MNFYDDCLRNEEAFSILMRKLSSIAIHLPRKEGKEILEVIHELEMIKYNDLYIPSKIEYNRKFEEKFS